MIDLFTLLGSYTTTPTDQVSGAPAVTTPLAETMSLVNQCVGSYDLTTDTVQTVSMGGITNANVVIVKALGGKIRTRITSADGSQQAIPVDGLLLLTAYSVPITAIDLLRTPGLHIIANVFIGQHG